MANIRDGALVAMRRQRGTTVAEALVGLLVRGGIAAFIIVSAPRFVASMKRFGL